MIEIATLLLKAIPQWVIITLMFATTLMVAGAMIAIVWIVYRKRITLTQIKLPFGVEINFGDQTK